MAIETQEYVNGMTPGPLTREIPDCMRDKFTYVQKTFEFISFILLMVGYTIQEIYRSIFGRKKKDLKGKIALVTGGGGGLGSLIALRLARLGCTIVLWDINKQGLEDVVKLVKGVGGKCYGYVVDLASREDIYRAAKEVQKDVGKVSLLVNNAGVLSGHNLMDTPDYLIQRTFDVNILAHFWTVKAFLPDMIESNDGHIVTVASMAGYVGVPKLIDYCSSKSAACGFNDSLNSELAALGLKGINTTLICPYFIRATGMFDSVSSRFIPTLNPNDVADRVVLAIQTNESTAIIPPLFKPLMPLIWILPWVVISAVIRQMVPDAVPASHAASATTTKTQIEKVEASNKSESRPMSLAQPARHDRHV